jgi:hypothetical protein
MSLTPGPWELVCTMCDEVHGEEYEVHAGDGSIVIAQPPSEADGRLIAAAPELLEACKDAATLLTMCSCDNGVHSPSGQSEGEHWLGLLREQIDRAIAKAEGGGK